MRRTPEERPEHVHHARDRLRDRRRRPAVREDRDGPERGGDRRGRRHDVPGRRHRHADHLRRRLAATGRLPERAARRGQARAHRRVAVHDRVPEPGTGQAQGRVRRAVPGQDHRAEPRPARRRPAGAEGLVPRRREGRVDRHRVYAPLRRRAVRRRRLHPAAADRRRLVLRARRRHAGGEAARRRRDAARGHGLHRRHAAERGLRHPARGRREDGAVRRRRPVPRHAPGARSRVAAVAAVLAPREPHLRRGAADGRSQSRAGLGAGDARQPARWGWPMTSRRTLLAVTVAALLGGAVAVVVAQNDMDKAEIRSEKLAGNVWVLYGAGGNIGLCAGADGAVLVDDEFAPLSAKIQAAVKQVADQPIRWVVNTHWHGDHVGGNENMAMGGAIVWFPHANVVHMGDTFFNGFYPIIDLASGGSIDGMIAASARVLPRLADDTKVIPGHGPAADKATLQKYHDMLVGVRAAVAKLVKEKKTLEQAVAAKPTTPWDEAWGKGFVKPDAFTTVLYTELSKRKP